MSDLSEQMQDPRGYLCYWRRIARKLSLSELGKQLGVRASQLSAFERGKPHELTEEQIQAYCALLEVETETSPEASSATSDDAHASQEALQSQS
ncbi:MAG TPA: helix-turn-helix transcriptional regulator [Thermomicrobiales bacterium]